MPQSKTAAGSGCWLVKSEPSAYAWDDLERDKRTRWDGVRNFEARNNLRAMKRNDLVLYYHSGEGKAIVGIAKVVKTGYPDPTAAAADGDWCAVDLAPVKPLARPVPLAALKADKSLAELALLRRPRISVVKILPAELAHILRLAETHL